MLKDHRSSLRRALLIFVSLLLLTLAPGCSDGSDDEAVAVGGGQGSPNVPAPNAPGPNVPSPNGPSPNFPTPNVPTPPVIAKFATVVLRTGAVSQQATATELRFTGFNSAGASLYGPETRVQQAETVFENVPVEVDTFLVETLADGVVVGSGVFRVVLEEDAVVFVGTEDVTPLEDAIVELAVSSVQPTVAFADTLQLQATATTDDGAPIDISGLVAWSVDKPKLASVSASGLLTANGLGNVTVTATVQTLSASATISIIARTSNVTKLEISPALARSAPGASRQYKVLGTFPDGSVRDVTSQAILTADKTGIDFAQGRALISTDIDTDKPAIVTAHLGAATSTATLRLGANLFSASVWDDTVRSYAIGSDGDLDLLQTISSPAAPEGLAVGTDGLHLYVGKANEGAVGVYEIGADGTLTSRPAEPLFGGGTTDLAMHPNGEVLYANGQSGDLVFIYQVAADGSLTYRDQVDTRGHEPRDLALTADGRFLYVVHSYSAEISVFSTDEETGDLTYVQTVTMPSRPWAANVNLSGTHLYVALGETNEIGTYAIGADGRITLIQRIEAHGGILSVAIDVFGRYAFAAAQNGSVGPVSFLVDGDGTLTFASESEGKEGPYDIITEPSGRFVYVSNAGVERSVSAYAINAEGTLEFLEAEPSGDGTYAIVASP